MKIKSNKYIQVKQSSYIIHFDFASYDPLPSREDIVSCLCEGLRNDFPNCSMNIREIIQQPQLES